MVSKPSLLTLLSVSLMSSKTVIHQAAGAEACKTVVVAIHWEEGMAPRVVFTESGITAQGLCIGLLHSEILHLLLFIPQTMQFPPSSSELIWCMQNFTWMRIKAVVVGKTVGISWSLSSSLRKGQSGGAASVPPECCCGALTWVQKWGCNSFQLHVPWPCLGQQTCLN